MRNDGARNVVSGLVVVAAVIGLASCSAARLTNVWKDPGYSGGPLRQVAVFVVGTDATVHRVTEDAFVQRLPASTRGLPATGSFPPRSRATSTRCGLACGLAASTAPSSSR
jgi:hypothetical protein